MVPVIILAVLTFGVLFVIDKGFTRVFRGLPQHKSGLSVRLNRKFCLAGIVLLVLSAVVLMADFGEKAKLMLFCGVVIALLGLALVVWYLTFGIFYDEEGFVLTTFGKRSVSYRYCDILGQNLFVTTGGGVIVELHMADTRAVSLQSNMDGVYPFLDRAFYRWCDQKGIEPAACDFHDPDNSRWFPTMEG